MDSSMLFDRWRQCVLSRGHIGATWQIRLNLCILLPSQSTTKTANGSVQPFSHSLRQKVHILYNRHAYDPPELPFPMGDLDLPCNTMLWVHASPQPKQHLDQFSHVCTDDRRVSQYWFACFPLKIVPSHVGIWTSCNTWFTGTTRVRNANGNLTVSAIFAGLISVTDWKSDRQTTLVGARQSNNA